MKRSWLPLFALALVALLSRAFSFPPPPEPRLTNAEAHQIVLRYLARKMGPGTPAMQVTVGPKTIQGFIPEDEHPRNPDKEYRLRDTYVQAVSAMQLDSQLLARFAQACESSETVGKLDLPPVYTTTEQGLVGFFLTNAAVHGREALVGLRVAGGPNTTGCLFLLEPSQDGSWRVVDCRDFSNARRFQPDMRPPRTLSDRL